MNDPDVPFTGASLDELHDFLSSDRSPPDCMQLSGLDGFMTAIAVGPGLMAINEWLPAVWGGDEPVFKDEAEKLAIVGAIFGRYDEIVNSVAEEKFEPILWGEDDGSVVARDWAEGFMAGVMLNLDAWEPLLKSKKQSLLMLPILALCGDEEGRSLLELEPEDEAEIAGDAANALSACASAIAEYWERRFIASIRKPARNDPCPCGSGRKFKKCCGEGP